MKGEKQMYAVIQTGGKQYKVAPGDEIYVERLASEAGDTVDFEVLMVEKDGAVAFGALAGKVLGKVVKNGRKKKVIVYKMKPKKNYRRKQGHRQAYTKVVIESIS
jgi:large subunit ribosomal protein L21